MILEINSLEKVVQMYLIGKTVGYAYKNYSKEDNIIKDIENFIESIQPEKDMRDYLMAYCASFLEGSNKEPEIYDLDWMSCFEPKVL
jgi:hypothetical protein